MELVKGSEDLEYRSKDMCENLQTLEAQRHTVKPKENRSLMQKRKPALTFVTRDARTRRLGWEAILMLEETRHRINGGEAGGGARLFAAHTNRSLSLTRFAASVLVRFQ